MTKLTERQLASIKRNAQRAVGRRGDGDEKLGLFIRVAESRIYNGKPVYKALLKEVIYLRMTDLHEGDLRIPKGTPWSKDYTKYEGWCYAKQEYLANRVGCKHKYANRVLMRITKDGYLKTRKYKGRDGAWHKQYFPDESFIDSKIRELEESADRSDDKSDDTTLSPLSGVASRHKGDSPVVIKTNSLSPLTHEPIALKATKDVSGSSFEIGLSSTTLRQPPSGLLNGVTPSNQEKANSTPQGFGAGEAKKEKTKAKPIPQPGYDYCQDCGSTDPGHVCDDFPIPVSAGFDVEEA